MFTTNGRPLGIADAIQVVRVGNPDLTVRNGVAGAVAALFAVAGGQSVGREGPIVQVAATTSHEVCRRLNVPPTQARTLAAAGAAAGIAASFNSPLGGAFFAMEALLGTFAMEAFAPVVVASVVGTIVGQLLLGDRLAVRLPPMELGSPLELLLFPILGVVCGIVAVGQRWMLRVAARELERIPGPPALRTMVSGLFAGGVAALGLSGVMGNGYPLMERLAAGTAGFGPPLLLALLIAKMVATALAYSGKSGGGLFAPTLFVGAVTGAYLATGLDRMAPGFAPHPGVFVVVGMGAVCAAVAHAPVTMALMIAEMTGNYALILPSLVTVAIATAIGNAVDRRSVYVQALLDRGVALARPAERVHDVLKVAEVMRRTGFATATPDAGFDAVAGLLLGQRQDEVFVVREGVLVGVIDLHDVKELFLDPAKRAGVTAGSLARRDPTVRSEDPLTTVMETFFRTGLETLAVVDGERLVGVVTERDVMGALLGPQSKRA
jgi:CIC family chloride channel protein